MIDKYDQETLDFILQHKPTDFFNFTHQRTIQCLNVAAHSEIHTIRELCLTPEHMFLARHNVGAQTVKEIKEALSKYGLRFGMLPCELKIEAKEEANVKFEPFIKYTRIILSDQDEHVSVYKDFAGDLNYPVINTDDFDKSGRYVDKLPVHYIYNDGNESPEFIVWWNSVSIDDSRREITLKDDFEWNENDFCLIYLIQNGWRLYQASDETADKILQAAGLDKDYKKI